MTFAAAPELTTATAANTGYHPHTTFSKGPSSDFDYSAFGYKGHFHGGTRIALIDWQGDGSIDEAFGIAPNNTIWHAWRNSGGWQEMPNNGRANNTDVAGTDSSGLNRGIAVDVGSQTWGSFYSNGHWGSWTPVQVV